MSLYSNLPPPKSSATSINTNTNNSAQGSATENINNNNNNHSSNTANNPPKPVKRFIPAAVRRSAAPISTPPLKPTIVNTANNTLIPAALTTIPPVSVSTTAKINTQNQAQSNPRIVSVFDKEIVEDQEFLTALTAEDSYKPNKPNEYSADYNSKKSVKAPVTPPSTAMKVDESNKADPKQVLTQAKTGQDAYMRRMLLSDTSTGQANRINNSDCIVYLVNLVSPTDTIDDDLHAEIKEECEKYGPVVKCKIIQLICYVQYRELKHAEAAIKALNGRFFAGNKITAFILPQNAVILRQMLVD